PLGTGFNFCEPEQPSNCFYYGSIDLGWNWSNQELVGTYFNLSNPIEAFSSSAFTHRWSMFVHLVNQDGLIVAQRDVYPANGTWAVDRLHFNPPPFYIDPDEQI